MRAAVRGHVNLFGMITTSGSSAYTPVALRSFFARTTLGPNDRFVLIDNDADFALPDDVAAARVTIVRPPTPLGFAQNANHLLIEARKSAANLFLLNNDLVFTGGWLEPLLTDRRALLSPLSNAQITHSAGRLKTEPAMDLHDYVGREADLEAIAREHRATYGGYQVVSAMPFFCMKIPRSVYEIVGDFDERFGKGGGEDRDYTIRAWMAGIPQEVAAGSFVLHFQGKSTWRGPETPEQQQQRDAEYTRAFIGKWGPALSYAFLRGNWNLFRSNAALARQIDQREFTPLVRHLRLHPSLEPFVTRRGTEAGAVVREGTHAGSTS
jgi:hypothetical protein